MKQQLSIEPAGNFIAARLCGTLTEAMLKDCQTQVLQLIGNMRRGKVLYDVREMEAPSIDLVLLQQKMAEELLAWTCIRRAIVVSDSRLAYLARIAFGEGDYRVFYNDIAAATKWLEDCSDIR